jgi:hypothetical protein
MSANRGNHGWKEVLLRGGIELREERKIARKKMGNGGGMRSG